MITLYTFGPPSVCRTRVRSSPRLKCCKKWLALLTEPTPLAFVKPGGLLPYIDDDGEQVADSMLIRWHRENKYRIDFEKGLSAEQRAIAWAFEKMAEDNLYWALVDARWVDEENFAKVRKISSEKSRRRCARSWSP
jgi:glutathione S-transferase-like protein